MTADELIAAIAPAVPGATYEALASADAAVTPTIGVPRELIVADVPRPAGPGPRVRRRSPTSPRSTFIPTALPRFDLVYHLVSPHRRARVRLKVRVNAQEAIDDADAAVSRAPAGPSASSTTCSASCSTVTPTCAG